MERVVRLDLAYDGTGFHGWASQPDPGIRTIEDVVRAELSRVLQEEPRLSVAGRTDAGVHARGQVASFSTRSAIHPARIRAVINRRLAPEVVVRTARYAPQGFDARCSATARVYRYVVRTEQVPDPFTGRFEWHRPGEVSVRSMRAAARELVGRHDFASFCRRSDGRSTVRELQRVTVGRHGGRLRFGLRADAFLHQMVRSLVGTLVAVGGGDVAPEEIPRILAARERAAAGPVAPPHGLTLERVVYGRATGSVGRPDALTPPRFRR
jgi:tRNA pseudouridine38-40 synthase